MNYSLFSENKHLVEKQLNKIVREINQQKESDKIFYNGYDNDFNLFDVINDLNTMPFLSEHKIIILENPIFLAASNKLEEKNAQLLIDYLKNPADFSTLIIYVNQIKADKRKKIYKDILKYTKSFVPKSLNDYEIKNIIKNDLFENNITISNHVLEEIFDRINLNFDNWENELEKLILFNQSNLETSDIDALIFKPSLNNVFDLANAVVSKDLRLSIDNYRKLSKDLKEEISIIMLLANQFRLICHTKILLDNNYYYKDLSKILNVHPYRIQLATNSAKKTTSDELLKILNKLANLEQQIKSGMIIPSIGFELFLIEVSKS